MVGDDPRSSRAVSRFGVRLRFDAGFLDGCGMVGAGNVPSMIYARSGNDGRACDAGGRGFTELGV